MRAAPRLFFSMIHLARPAGPVSADEDSPGVGRDVDRPPKFLSLVVDAHCAARLLAEGSQRERATLRSNTLQSSGAFIAMPMLPQWRIPTASGFRFLLRRRLALPIVPGPPVAGWRCPLCQQLGVVDEWGDHVTSCGGRGQSFIRHNEVARTLATVLRQARLNVQEDVGGLVRLQPVLRCALPFS